MVLICDVCHIEISKNPNNDEFTPRISLFPCFHKHCDGCKGTVHIQNGRLTCKVCGCQFLPKHIYDYAETQLEKLFCLLCNLKNRAQVEWRCENCQSYMCNACTKPHIASGHSLTPVKAFVPSHSQCQSHLGVPASYLCSCQTRLCLHCLSLHANGQSVAPHEQRYSFVQLADQARLRIQTIRANSQRELDKAQKILPVLDRNKKFVHEVANKARMAVADQIVELCNALIRRGNDIVTHIDLFEHEKLQKYETVENELKRVVDHFKKINVFSENVLVVAQNDHPGMYSACEFVENSVSLITKKLETLQPDIALTQPLPQIIYQSDLTQLINCIQNLGLVDVDGQKTVPLLTTPSNAQMFSVANGPVSSQQTAPSVPLSTIRPTLTSIIPHVSSTVRNGPALLRPNHNVGQMVANVSVSAVPANPFNVPLPPNVGIVQPTQQQHHQQLIGSGRIMNAPQVSPVHIVPASTAGTGILSHLLQQGVNSIALSGPNNSQPNTPTTPNFPHIRQQNQPSVHHQQQIVQQQQQQHQFSLHQQQMQRQQAVRNPMIWQQQQQQQQFFQQQQQQQRSSVNIQQNQLILKQLQAQQHQFQQQQMQRQIEQQSLSGIPSSTHSQTLPQNPNISTATEQERPLLVRLPNPYKQQPHQQQLINPAFSVGSPSAMAPIASPSHTRQVIQPPQQQLRRELNTSNPVQQQKPTRPLQHNPILVELMDDDEEEVDKAKRQNHAPYDGGAYILESHEQRTQMNHSQISRLKAQSAAADSTVNAGNGSSDDSSASPCPSTSVPKRPPVPPVAMPEPSHKRLAIENSHGIIGTNRIAIDIEEGPTRPPSISTTMVEANAKATGHETHSQEAREETALTTDKVMVGTTKGQNEMIAEPKQTENDESDDQAHQDGGVAIGSDQYMEEQQSTSKECQNTELDTAKSPPKSGAEKLHEDDWWDDYCFVCSQGCDDTTGSLGCCDTCPKVFHAKCHVPMISKTMEELPNGWQCTLCLPCDPLTQISHLFGEREKLLCSKVFLSCFVDFSHVEPFLNAVASDESDYYAVIKEPIWLNKIAGKISSGEYKMISEFVEDMNLLFRNCSTFNLPTNPLSTSGKKVYTLYMKAMREFLPAYEKQIWIYVSLYNARISVAGSNDEETARRRCSKRGGQKAKSQTPG